MTHAGHVSSALVSIVPTGEKKKKNNPHGGILFQMKLFVGERNNKEKKNTREYTVLMKEEKTCSSGLQ